MLYRVKKGGIGRPGPKGGPSGRIGSVRLPPCRLESSGPASSSACSALLVLEAGEQGEDGCPRPGSTRIPQQKEKDKKQGLPHRWFVSVVSSPGCPDCCPAPLSCCSNVD